MRSSRRFHWSSRPTPYPCPSGSVTGDRSSPLAKNRCPASPSHDDPHVASRSKALVSTAWWSIIPVLWPALVSSPYWMSGLMPITQQPARGLRTHSFTVLW